MKRKFLTTVISIALPLVIISASAKAKDFEVISDSRRPLIVEVFNGTCKKLADEVRKKNNETFIGKLKNGAKDVKNTILSESDCADKGMYELKKKGDKIPISAGQKIIALKNIKGAEGFIPAFCTANPNKGKILRLYTPKSLGFGLACEQIEKMPKK